MKNKILIVAAHADDEVLGCGGTIARHVALGDEVKVLVLSDGESSRDHFDVDFRKKCLEKACSVLGVESFYCADLKDGLLDTYPIIEIVRIIEKYSSTFRPRVIYTHSSADLNPDHQVAHRAVINAFRAIPDSFVDQIHCFEVPSSTEWNNHKSRQDFIPNMFIEIHEEHFKLKMQALRCYEQELRTFPHPRSEEYISSLMKVRGGMVGVKLAEAFFTERFIQRQFEQK